MDLSVRKLTVLAFYTTISLAVYAIEIALPTLVPIPGIKPGLANIVTLLLLRRYSAKEASLVLTARILLSTLLFGQAMSLFYSCLGGLFAILIMTFALNILGKNCLMLAGAAGGLAHNLGQLLAALLITQTMAVVSYLPLLAIGGIVAGLFTGAAATACSKYLTPRMNKIMKF